MAKRARTLRRPRRPKRGAAPGTLVAAPDGLLTPIRVMRFTPSEVEETTTTQVADLRLHLERPGVVWMDVEQAPDAQTLEGLRALLDLHPLAVADAANVPQRPKHEGYANFDFIVLRTSLPPLGDEVVRTEQISLFVGDRWVLSVQEERGDAFEPVRSRLREAAGSIRQNGADYLGYALIDAVVDGFFPVVESAFDRLEQIEIDMTEQADRTSLQRLHRMRSELLHLRRAVWPMREALMTLTRQDVGRFTQQTRLYLRDCYDHAVQVLDLVETSRETATGLVDLHLSLVGFKTNEVMKVLTIISTIFLPLTFIAGVYGMNFDMTSPWNMPELQWRYGYLFSLVLMGLCVVGLLAYFRHKGWMGGDGDELTTHPGSRADSGGEPPKAS